MADDLKKLIDDMSPEEKLLVLSYFSANREEFLFAAAEAKARFERADGYRSDQPDAAPTVRDAELETARADSEKLARFRTFLDEDFRQWCSPNGVAARYATDLLRILDQGGSNGRAAL